MDDLCHFVFENVSRNDLPCTVHARTTTAQMQHWKYFKCIFSLHVSQRWNATQQHSLREAYKLTNPAHVVIQSYAKSEHDDGTIPAAIKSGRLLDVPIIC
jgi:hypothetical protein